jgi:phosphopantothenoylcysteine synthetase/decarboxylase
MYENVATQHNLEILKQRGWTIIEPRVARLACGYEGKGALAEVGVIIEAVEAALKAELAAALKATGDSS